MNRLYPRPKEGEGEVGTLVEAFPSVYYARNPYHPVHHRNGLLSSRAFVDGANHYHYPHSLAGLAQRDAFGMMEAQAFTDGTRFTEGLEWHHRLIGITDSVLFHQTLIAGSALLAAYERRDEAGEAMPDPEVYSIARQALLALEQEGLMGRRGRPIR